MSLKVRQSNAKNVMVGYIERSGRFESTLDFAGKHFFFSSANHGVATLYNKPKPDPVKVLYPGLKDSLL